MLTTTSVNRPVTCRCGTGITVHSIWHTFGGITVHSIWRTFGGITVHSIWHTVGGITVHPIWHTSGGSTVHSNWRTFGGITVHPNWHVHPIWHCAPPLAHSWRLTVRPFADHHVRLTIASEIRPVTGSGGTDISTTMLTTTR